jgi:hypothetical protein
MILNSKIIICAGGDGGISSGRWNGYLGVSKHMIPVKSEPLIHRTQRQFLQKGFTNIHLSCSLENKSKYLIDGISFFPSPKCIGHIGERSNVWHYRKHLDYNGTTVIIFGDVYYTDELIDAVSKDANDTFKIYGRSNASAITKNYRQGEPFAIIMHKDYLTKYFQALKSTMIVLPEYIKRGVAIPEDLAKYTYRKVVGIPYEAQGHIVESKHWIDWDDLTDDFDYPEDWDIKSNLFPHIFYIKS